MYSLLVTGSSGYVGSQFIKSCGEKHRILRFSLQSHRMEEINFGGVQAVLHCAGIVHKGNRVSADKYHDINVEYPIHLAKLAKSKGVKHFMFLSSVSVYGAQTHIDELSVCKPSNAYGHSKFNAEQELLKLNSGDFKVSILRIPMVYGLRAPGNINLLCKLVTYMPLIPLGNISNKRSFIAIQNLIYSMHQILMQNKPGIFLLADDAAISTSRLLEILINSRAKKRVLFKSSTSEFLVRNLSLSMYDKLWGDLVVDCSAAKRDLGLRFPVSVEVGVADVLKPERLVAKL